MFLVNSAYEKSQALLILEEGLRPRRETGVPATHGESTPDCIYLTATESFSRAKRWGHYHFSVSNDFVRKHSEQFKYFAYVRDSKFKRFLQENNMGFLEERILRNAVIVPTYHQVISLQPVPLEVLDSLAISLGHYDERFLKMLESYADKNGFAS
jgi:hypothetical protein